MSQKDRMKSMVADLARQGQSWNKINETIKNEFGKSYRKTDMLKDIAAAKGREQKPLEERQKNVPKKLLEKRRKAAAKSRDDGRRFEPMKGRITYNEMDRVFDSWSDNYNYEVSYIVKNGDGSTEEKVIIIASDSEMTKREIFERTKEILSDESYIQQYGAKLIKSSLRLIGAYKRRFFQGPRQAKPKPEKPQKPKRGRPRKVG